MKSLFRLGGVLDNLLDNLGLLDEESADDPEKRA